MKKIDKLILMAFAGPFILSFFVVVFILLTQHMLKYFDDIIGKDLGWDVIGQLLFYFAVFLTSALPLGVLFASLIAFGNPGEHFELTAVKVRVFRCSGLFNRFLFSYCSLPSLPFMSITTWYHAQPWRRIVFCTTSNRKNPPSNCAKAHFTMAYPR